MADNNYKKKKIPVAVRNSVWNTYIGEEYGRGECYICNGVITHGTFACGHVVAEANGGETILRNLRPICTSCNSSQGIRNMAEFKKEYGLGGKDINELPDNIDEEEKILKYKKESKKEKHKELNKDKKKKIEKKEKSREEIIKDNCDKLSREKYKLFKNKRFLHRYISKWYGIENYFNRGIFSPRKSDIQGILMEFDKPILKIICNDLHLEYTNKHKKNELID